MNAATLTEQEWYSLRWIAQRYASGDCLYKLLLNTYKTEDEATNPPLVLNRRQITRLRKLIRLDGGSPEFGIPCLGGRVAEWLTPQLQRKGDRRA